MVEKDWIGADLIFDNHEVGEQPNTAEILAAKFRSATTDEVVQWK